MSIYLDDRQLCYKLEIIVLKKTVSTEKQEFFYVTLI